ncbi:MAG TPA: glycosyltransferase family 4 protein [Solirubrobacteraceae bacterium]|nr:glycosyltransferase family 4 protein [Solirubrobacteraceae bacterium]
MPRIALLPWGDVIEDFLDPLGLGLENLRDEMTGGWMFGYIEALARTGVETALIVVSRSVSRPTRWRHRPTGAPLIVLPEPRVSRLLRRTLVDPYGWTVEDSAGSAGIRSRLAAQPGRQLAPYSATPVRALGRELRSMRAAALLCQEYEYPRFDVCVVLGRLLRLPVIGTYQGGDAPRTGLERLVRPLSVRGARGLVVGPSGEADRVRTRYGLAGNRIARIPNPLDVDRWSSARQPQIRGELGLSQDAVVVAWHGRVELHRKGLDVLLDAWANLMRSPSNSHRLLLIGNGRDAEPLRWWIREHRLAGIVWLDEYIVDKARMAAYLSAADIYAFPSRHEGFPVAPIEAMAAGLPVVATAAPGVAEIAPQGERSGVVVVPRDDVAAFTEAIAALIENPARRSQIGECAQRRAAEGFSLETVGRQLRGVLLGTGSATSHR